MPGEGILAAEEGHGEEHKDALAPQLGHKLVQFGVCSIALLFAQFAALGVVQVVYGTGNFL